MKKKLIIEVEIDCGRKFCDGCDYEYDGNCELFDKELEIEIRKDGIADYIRCPECLEAERRSKNGD